jgi:hypothetical protein
MLICEQDKHQPIVSLFETDSLDSTMDEHYNFQTAGMLLLVISTQSNIIYLSDNSQQYHGRTPEIQTRRTTCHHEISKQTSMIFINISLIETLQEYIDSFTIEKTTHPTCWRILRGINRVEKQELVMRIQGIICLKDLPPLQLG